MRPLYTVPRNFNLHNLEVSDGFTLSYATAGNPTGLPVLVLHGGPGGGMHSSMFRFFHPDLFRVITFDQRGCSGSPPLAETKNNNSWLLLDDIQTLRAHLGIDQWLIFGGSWGSTLALLAAQQHPEQALGLVLRGIFLGRPKELDWFLYGIGNFFPDAWDAFRSAVDAAPGDDLLALYSARLGAPDPEVRLAAAHAWTNYEVSCSTLMPSAGRSPQGQRSDDMALSLATLEAHYFTNRLFLDGYDILEECKRIAHLPVHIIQGRYDMICPPTSAFELHRQLPHSTLKVVPNAGHSSMESGIASSLITAVEQLHTSIRETARC